MRTTPVAPAPATLAPALVATAHATALATSVPPSPLTPRCSRRDPWRAASPTSVQVRWPTEEESDGSPLGVFVESFAKVLEDQQAKPMAKPKTAYACFLKERLTPIHKGIWNWTNLNHPLPSCVSTTDFNHAVSHQLSREWKALSAEQKQAYQPAPRCAKADPHIAGQVRIERPKPEKCQRVAHSRKAGVGGEAARARLEVKQPRTIEVTISNTQVIVQTASTRTTAPPGKKWNARARKCV